MHFGEVFFYLNVTFQWERVCFWRRVLAETTYQIFFIFLNVELYEFWFRLF